MIELKKNSVPYKDLYIYYIQGKVPHASEKLLKSDNYIGNWIEEDTSFLFFTQESKRSVHDLLARQPELTLLDSFEMPYDEWCGGQFEVISISDLLIAPPWMPGISAIENNPVWLNPGVVFGAGTHPTTYDCLLAIDKAFSLAPIETMVDIGTGTGLLSLFAARKGAKKIVAMDLNPLASKTAHENVILNKMADKIVVTQGDARNLMVNTMDLWVANIHYDILVSLIQSSEFMNHQMFVLSGLLPSQALKVQEILDMLAINVIQTWENAWFTCLGITHK